MAKDLFQDTRKEIYKLRPPDGGWGWLVLAGSMMVNILIPGTIKSFGVLFLVFLEAFHASPATAAWIPALCYFLYSSLGPISSILSVKYSYRTVTMIGGAFAAFGMITSFWASSVTYLYLSYGVFVGVGAGLSFPPTVYIVTSYFVKLRGLANGLCISGSALGAIILPPVLTWLLKSYGYRGTFLIMGGITLNVFVAALFYDPVEQHLVQVPSGINTFKDSEEEDAGIVLSFENVEDFKGAKSLDVVQNQKSKKEQEDQSSTSIQLSSNIEHHVIRSASAVAVQSFINGHEDSRSKKYSKHPQRNQTFTIAQINSPSSMHTSPDGIISSRLVDKNISKSRLTGRCPSASSFHYISTPYHGSTLSFQPKEFSSHLSLKSNSTGVCQEGLNENGKSILKRKSTFFDLSLLKDPMYLVILVSNSTNAIGYTNFVILLPAYGVALGFDQTLANYLISVVSTADLIGRIGGSALSDLGYIPKTWYFIGGLAVSGISLAVLPLSTSYAMVSFWCATFGLASGIYVGITAVIMADMLGTERLTSSYSISLFVNGILQLIGPPICGFWFEKTATYKPLFHTLGVVLISGASLWCLMPFIKNRKYKTENLGQKLEDDLLKK